MYRFRFVFSFIIIISFLLNGCTNNSVSETDNNQAEFIPLSTNESLDQQLANKAKQSIAEFDEVSSIKAVNTEEKIVIAFEVNHFDRLQLKEIKKKVEKKVKKELKELKASVSTDKKIFLELEKLEEKIQSNEINKKELKKKLDKIIKLSEEQT